MRNLMVDSLSSVFGGSAAHPGLMADVIEIVLLCPTSSRKSLELVMLFCCWLKVFADQQQRHAACRAHAVHQGLVGQLFCVCLFVLHRCASPCVVLPWCFQLCSRGLFVCMHKLVIIVCQDRAVSEQVWWLLIVSAWCAGSRPMSRSFLRCAALEHCRQLCAVGLQQPQGRQGGGSAVWGQLSFVGPLLPWMVHLAAEEAPCVLHITAQGCGVF